MNDFGMIVTLPDFTQLDGRKAMAILHDHAGEIADEIETRIEDRTPVLTGALKEDETYKLGSGALLVSWFVGDAYQMAEWGRPYALVQEGPPLGAVSDPQGIGDGWPHQMYFRVSTDDLPLILDWAQQLVEQAADAMAEAAQAGATTWEI